jgi:hypothetical protein
VASAGGHRARKAIRPLRLSVLFVASSSSSLRPLRPLRRFVASSLRRFVAPIRHRPAPSASAQINWHRERSRAARAQSNDLRGGGVRDKWQPGKGRVNIRGFPRGATRPPYFHARQRESRTFADLDAARREMGVHSFSTPPPGSGGSPSSFKNALWLAVAARILFSISPRSSFGSQR